jgi:hypothetical protein
VVSFFGEAGCEVLKEPNGIAGGSTKSSSFYQEALRYWDFLGFVYAVEASGCDVGEDKSSGYCGVRVDPETGFPGTGWSYEKDPGGWIVEVNMGIEISCKYL